MSINATLTAALRPVGPVHADTYEGPEEVYLTFNYNSIPTDYGDDEPSHERFLVQAHLFAPSATTPSPYGGPSKRPYTGPGRHGPAWKTPPIRTANTSSLSVKWSKPWGWSRWRNLRSTAWTP